MQGPVLVQKVCLQAETLAEVASRPHSSLASDLVVGHLVLPRPLEGCVRTSAVVAPP